MQIKKKVTPSHLKFLFKKKNRPPHAIRPSPQCFPHKHYTSTSAWALLDSSLSHMESPGEQKISTKSKKNQSINLIAFQSQKYWLYRHKKRKIVNLAIGIRADMPKSLILQVSHAAA